MDLSQAVAQADSQVGHLQGDDYDFYDALRPHCGGNIFHPGINPNCVLNRGYFLDDQGYFLGRKIYWGNAHPMGGLCNLNTLWLSPFLKARPALSVVKGHWYLSPGDVHATLVVLGGSDVLCTVANVNISSLLNLVGEAKSYEVQNTIDSKSFELPLGAILTKLAGPINIPTPESDVLACPYPNIDGLALGQISSESYGTVKLDVHGTYKAVRLAKITLTDADDHDHQENAATVDIPLLATGSPSLLITSGQCPSADSPPVTLAGAPVAGEKFRILGAVSSDYRSLSANASGVLRAKNGKWGAPWQTFRVDRVEIVNANGEVLVEIHVTGSLSGSVYFWGTPIITHNGRVVAVPDVDLAAESRVALLNKDVRLPDVIVNLFRESLRQALTVDIGPDIDRIVALGSKDIPLKGLGDLSLGPLGVEPISVRSEDAGLVADILVTGAASVTVTPRLGG